MTAWVFLIEYVQITDTTACGVNHQNLVTTLARPINNLYILNLFKMLLIVGHKNIVILNTICRYE